MTDTTHILPFERLSAEEFERLCLWLVRRQGYELVEHLGVSGSEQGRDIAASLNGQIWAFQCKRVRKFSLKDAQVEAEKMVALPESNRPHGVIFVVTCPVSARTRQMLRERYSNQLDFSFWAITELDERVKQHREIVEEFFGHTVSEKTTNIYGSLVEVIQPVDSSIIINYKADRSSSLGATPTEFNVDFAPYLSRFIESYRNEEVADHYVDLTYSHLKLTVTTKNGRAELVDNWIELDEPIDNFILRWLESEDKRQLSILGDFGSGKTSLCKHITHILAKSHLAEPANNRIPVLISLNRGNQFGTIKNIILHFFKTEWGLDIDYDLFLWLAKSGKLCVILDGFDEMAALVDESVRRFSFEIIREISQAPNKVIVTGRPGYFPKPITMYEIFGRRDQFADVYEELRQQLRAKLGLKIQFEIARLRTLADGQINSILRTYEADLEEEFESWFEIRKSIDGIYNLKDLVTRPILLHLVIKTLPKLKGTDSAKVDIAKLYDIYTGYWCDVDWKKGEIRHLQTGEERRVFMEFLAKEMLWSQRLSIPCEEIPTHVSKHRKRGDTELCWHEHDVRTCSFLKLSDDGLFEFVHQSFMEYFLAKALFFEALTGQTEVYQTYRLPAGIELEKRIPLTDGTVLFLKTLVEEHGDGSLSQILFYNRWACGIKKGGGSVLCL